jgi:hypothetical protein
MARDILPPGLKLPAGLNKTEEFSVKYPFAIAALGLLVLGFLASTRAEDQAVPAATNVPGAQTPNIHPDRRITFSLKAPDAASLQVAGGDGLGMGSFPMTKGTDGTWSVTTPPSVPGFHYYWFVLNGVAVNDPASETYFGYGKETSAIEVPESGCRFLRHPECSARRSPCQVVPVKNHRRVASPPTGGSSAWLQDLHAAMAGLSMGGMQTLFITLQHLDLFAYVGSFSGPIIPGLNTGNLTVNRTPEAFDTKTAYGGAFADPSTFNRRVKLLWLGVGTAESDQFRSGIGGAVEALRMAGVRLEYFESNGTAHEWQTWRRDLNAFAPRLFR